MYKKILFDCSYCIKNILSLKNLKMLRKVLFSCTSNGAERHITCKRFENAASRANVGCHFEVTLYTLLMMTSDFVTALECLYVKPCINSMWIGLLIYHTCEPSRIIREPPWNGARLLRVRQNLPDVKIQKKKIPDHHFCAYVICMVISVTCCWKAINS